MIKLNNKNITYVALADSSNSLKAPKEIWYADSSNSVKLVYRRKDALIEGVDYEKYHWLEGTTDAYISGVKYNVWQNRIQIKVGEVVPTPAVVYGYFVINRRDGANIPSLSIYKNAQNNQDFLQVIFRQSQGHIADIIPYQGFGESTMNFYVNNGVATVEQDGLVYSGESLIENTWNVDIELTDANNKMAKVSYIRELLPNNTYRSNLIPCKLLKPVPKWLDANGIRRQVGECGMIDLISGKFYGNVNSVGTFTVENYYERKEWLIADVPSNTRCIDLPINSNEMSYSMLISKCGNTSFFETIGNYRYYTAIGKLPSVTVWNISTSSDEGDFNVGLQENQLFNITSNDSSLTINGIGVQKFGFPISAIVFRSGIYYTNGVTKTSSISVDGIERYIPCTLTMDLPASMDANGIARTKGTSGMWDLVSDRFYGNVASSGTFKAVNLAEGVDYEVHQWLQGDGTAYIDTGHNINEDLDWETVVDELGSNKCLLWQRTGSTPDGKNTMLANTVDYYTGLRVANNSTEVLVTPPQGQIHVLTSANKIYINNMKYTVTKNIDINTNLLLFYSQFRPYAVSDGVKCSYFKLKDGSSIVANFVPVKLLRSIPSKYDANGIARQVGECGMYDTVNDVFYGNVASGGSFSVSDDN